MLGFGNAYLKVGALLAAIGFLLPLTLLLPPSLNVDFAFVGKLSGFSLVSDFTLYFIGRFVSSHAR